MLIPNDSLVLGLDIGSSSVGWSLIQNRGEAVEIVASGVRVFPWTVDEQTLMSRSVERRRARQRRRQLERRARRRRLVASLLQRQGFLPPGPPDHRDPSWKAVLAMDPYELRGRALETRLEPWEFGRVMYHLAHRRGFAGSGRGADDSETGVIQEQIEKTAREMQKVNARTLGEFLAQLDPRERRRRG